MEERDREEFVIMEEKLKRCSVAGFEDGEGVGWGWGHMNSP